MTPRRGDVLTFVGVETLNTLITGRADVPPTEPMDPDEVAARVHHRMVLIHPFPNGNGRHSREFADLLLRSCGCAPFTWGSRSLNPDRVTRDAYIAALRRADDGDYGPLRAFVHT